MLHRDNDKWNREEIDKIDRGFAQQPDKEDSRHERYFRRLFLNDVGYSSNLFINSLL